MRQRCCDTESLESITIVACKPLPLAITASKLGPEVEKSDRPTSTAAADFDVEACSPSPLVELGSPSGCGVPAASQEFDVGCDSLSTVADAGRTTDGVDAGTELTLEETGGYATSDNAGVRCCITFPKPSDRMSVQQRQNRNTLSPKHPRCYALNMTAYGPLDHAASGCRLFSCAFSHVLSHCNTQSAMLL